MVACWFSAKTCRTYRSIKLVLPTRPGEANGRKRKGQGLGSSVEGSRVCLSRGSAAREAFYSGGRVHGPSPRTTTLKSVYTGLGAMARASSGERSKFGEKTRAFVDEQWVKRAGTVAQAADFTSARPRLLLFLSRRRCLRSAAALTLDFQRGQAGPRSINGRQIWTAVEANMEGKENLREPQAGREKKRIDYKCRVGSPIPFFFQPKALMAHSL